MNIPPDENQLHAWLDGELDSASHQAVSDWLVQHPDIAAQVEGWRQDKLRLQQSLQRNMARTTFTPLQPAQLRQRRARQRYQRLALACSLVLALGIGSLSGWQMTERLQNHPLPMEDAVQAYRLFGDGAQQATMDISTHQTTQLASWLSRYFINGTLPPNLERFGYQLIGARLMANEHGASALVLYQTASGTRVGWYIRPQTVRLEKGSRQADNLVAQYWSDRHYNYALVSPMSGEAAPALRAAIGSEVG